MHIIQDTIYETEYYLTIINIIYILGFIDAKRCDFLTKTYKDIKYDWYNSKIIFQYKSMISSVNCEDGNICCRTTGRTCCSDPSVSKDEDIFLYVILIFIQSFIFTNNCLIKSKSHFIQCNMYDSKSILFSFKNLKRSVLKSINLQS